MCHDIDFILIEVPTEQTAGGSGASLEDVRY